jgi:hypothetical protein
MEIVNYIFSIVGIPADVFSKIRAMSYFSEDAAAADFL